MMDVGRHPNIEMMTFSEVESVTGFVGNFNVSIRKKAKYVEGDSCTACNACAEVCPVAIPDEYQQGFSSRRAIYIPFPQAVPSAYILDMENCLGNNPIACGKCKEACEKHCIDYDMKDEFVNIEVGTIIVATGIDVFDPSVIPEYGYGRFENVITSMEFERLICASGPVDGHFIRPTDRTLPLRVGFVQCVGSRSAKYGNPYCSNICCMNTVKDTLLLHDHYPDVQSKVFYMDMRAFGKGFEDMYMRSKAEGIKYIRGLPAQIEEDPKTKNLIATVENTVTNKVERHEFDMIVLSVGVEPRHDSASVQKLLTLSHTSDGFFLEAHPKLKPVDAPTKGVYFAGCAEAPKDIKESVTQAGAAAARSSILLNAGEVKIEAITPILDENICNFCGRCSKVCPYNAIEKPIKKSGLYPRIIEAACAGCGTCGAECTEDAIKMRHFQDNQLLAQVEGILGNGKTINKIIAFACNWCSYAGGDGAGTARLQYPASARLIRTMCSGRVDEKFIIRAFELGAPIVLLSGCHFSDCHYISAVQWTQVRVEKLWNKLEKLSIRPERLQLEWISAAEGQKFARVMRRLEEMRQKVTQKEIDYTMQVLHEEKEAKEAAKKNKATKKKKKKAPVAT